ncbi:chain-length determining protein [Ralstonia pseudosolanacearum]|uniref:chain-length determining protein n=1 Tax=Ralstonia pseudosolanacearum TaxID=1310165 RepID=UPI002675F330|nr:chain-length determining protein [Ralstonia pseudosolanacearum]MDO3523131.1 chain-length determining protein [Ralstonia pseudosolanacearum]MDO3526273.1 chain-length determining protein [Ralstonia pseudosolanacearum]MDO3531353.1 chain-length determining protein [Ralstonia pseudosolanacearum]MDO3546856.1 chain-length determining protein [Ralstonia pseudosolanacearum]MDO3552320.1 chain-length determining protein [Ralstonia pseudosolanacearum]
MNSDPRFDDDRPGDAAIVMLAQGAQFAQRHAKKLVAGGIAGAALAIGLALVLPKQWEASVVIQVGQITNEAMPGTPLPAPTPVETVGRAVERLQLPQFEDLVLRKLGLPLEVNENASTDLIRRSLKAVQLKNADLIEVTVRGFSQADAQRYTQAFSDALIGAHAVIAKPSLDKINANMAEVRQQISAEEARKGELSALMRARDQAKSEVKFSESVLLASMVAENDKQLQGLRQREINIREQLNPERTFNTRLFDTVHVSRRHVFPSGLLFAAGGLVLGLLVAIGCGLTGDFRRGRLGSRK